MEASKEHKPHHYSHAITAVLQCVH